MRTSLALHLELGLHDIGFAATVERLGIVAPLWMKVIVRSLQILEPRLLGLSGHSPLGNAVLDKAIEMHAAKAAAPSLNDMEALCYPNR